MGLKLAIDLLFKLFKQDSDSEQIIYPLHFFDKHGFGI